MSDVALSTTCSCRKCAKRCEVMPGWMTPDEAECAMSAGMGPRLMLDWLEPDDDYGNTERVLVLCPAAVDCEMGRAPEFAELWPGMHYLQAMFEDPLNFPCTFLKNGLCEIHASGFKPKQCRESFGCRPNVGPTKYDIARDWDTENGRVLVARWQREFAR